MQIVKHTTFSEAHPEPYSEDFYVSIEAFYNKNLCNSNTHPIEYYKVDLRNNGKTSWFFKVSEKLSAFTKDLERVSVLEMITVKE